MYPRLLCRPLRARCHALQLRHRRSRAVPRSPDGLAAHRRLRELALCDAVNGEDGNLCNGQDRCPGGVCTATATDRCAFANLSAADRQCTVSSSCGGGVDGRGCIVNGAPRGTRCTRA